MVSRISIFTLFLLCWTDIITSQEEFGSCVCSSIKWVKVTEKKVPEAAIYVGHDIHGYQGNVYVGRGRINGSVIPGKFVAWQGNGYIIFNGQDILQKEFEVLTVSAPVKWIPASVLTDMPPRAIRGGLEKCGEDLYICRVVYQDTFVSGRLDVAARTCTISLYGPRVYKKYDVLILA